MAENKTQQLLINPLTLAQEFPISENSLQKIQRARDTARKIISGQDKRFMVIVGPCSIHDVNAALEFAERLQKTAARLSDELFVVMRTYFEKPRTTTGWKGLINDPHLNGTFDSNHGLKLARKLLIDLADLNVPVGTEFLNPIIPHYLGDLVTWSAIGARTAESQLHRELASGLAMPVGFKNNTNGNVQIAIDAVHAARQPHHFLGVNQQGAPAIVSTNGNDHCHIILRGAEDDTNYSAEHVQHAAYALEKFNLASRLMVDCSHGNSMKHHRHQITAAKSVIEQIMQGSEIIFGAMIESNLVAGNQRLENKAALQYGQSITDECISWDDTVVLLEELAHAVRQRN